MKIHIRDSKLFLVTAMVILVIIVSAFGYNWIVHEEARTGGMGEKWHMSWSQTYWPMMDMQTLDSSILFTDSEHHLITLVDADGSVRWSHDYGSELVYTEIVDDNVYLIDVTEEGQYALDCIGMDGIWKWTTPCPPILRFAHGDDGREYASGYTNSNIIINTTIYSIEGGSINWAFTQNGSLTVDRIWNDGRVLLHHMNFDEYLINNSYTTVLDSDEMILLSENGTPVWNLPFPTEGGSDGRSRAEVANNGTIVLVHEYPIRAWESARISQGYSVSGTLIWTRNESYDSSIRTDSYFGCLAMEGNVESVFKVDMADDSNSWNILLNDTWGGSMYDLEGIEIFVSSNGQAYCMDPNGSILWHIDGGLTGSSGCAINPELGILAKSHHSIMMIGIDGSCWVYDGLDSTIIGARFGPDGTVIAMTEDKLVMIHKPTVSMPTEYLIAMLSVDLLITLSLILWIADRLVKKEN